MSYIIQWSSELNGDTNPTPSSIGKSTITIVNNSFDNTTTSLTLTGQGLSGYGAYQQENFIRLMENFASEYAPISPTVGQLWFDTTSSTLSLYIQTTASPAAYAWESVYPIALPASIPVISATAPSNPEVGLIWYDTATNVISIYTASNSITGAPSATGGWTPFFNPMPGSTVNSLTGTANQITLSGSTGTVNIALSPNIVLPTATTGTTLTVNNSGAGSGTALIVNGPTNNTTIGSIMYSGNVTSTFQVSPVLMLQQQAGAAYGGNGAALMLGALSNNNPLVPVAGIWSYLVGGGTGGSYEDHIGNLVIGTKGQYNTTGPIARVIFDYGYNMYPAVTNTGSCGIPSLRWAGVYSAQIYADTLNGSGAGLSAGSVPLTSLAAYTINVTAGTGLTGGGTINLGGSLTLTNSGVTSLGAGAGITISAATGGVTITNSGVRTLSASTGIGVSGTTGAVTVTNTGVTSFNGRTGATTLSQADVNGVYGYTPANPALYATLAQLAAAASSTAGSNGKIVIGAVTVIWGTTSITYPGSAYGTIQFWHAFSAAAYICIPVQFGQATGNFATTLGIQSLAAGSAVVSVNSYTGPPSVLQYIAIGPT